MNSLQVGERILVLDDDQVILELLERVLSREGYRVTAMYCSEKAVSTISTERFDLAIVDVGLRSLNGGKLMKMIRETSPETAIVVVTGYPTEDVVRLAHEHAQGYLEKPFGLQEFLGLVRSTLEEERH